MSVNFAIRRVGERVVAALRAHPTLTEQLCDFQLDFDAAAYERRALEGLTPERAEDRRLSLGIRINRIEAAQHRVLEILAHGGIPREDVEVALDIGRSWWAMEAMIEGEQGKRLIREHDGEAIGDDVGYGPARLFGPDELSTIAVDLAAVTRAGAESRFRIFESADIVANRSRGFEGAACTDEELDEWSWLPLCRVRDYTASAARDRRWLLRWYH